VIYEIIVFPEPAMDQKLSARWKEGREKCARKPFTHKREPVDFQFAKVLPWVNHVAVPG